MTRIETRCARVIDAIIITMITAISINPIIPTIAITSNLSARSPIPIPYILIPAESDNARV